jgi:hypothetical protein
MASAHGAPSSLARHVEVGAVRSVKESACSCRPRWDAGSKLIATWSNAVHRGAIQAERPRRALRRRLRMSGGQQHPTTQA